MKYYNNPKVFQKPILECKKTGYCAQVLVFDGYTEYLDWLAKNKQTKIWAQVPGNRIAIVFAGTLDGGRIKADYKVLPGLMAEMAGFYQKEILKTNNNYLI